MLQSQAKLSDRGAQMTELHLRTSAMTRLLAREKRLRFVMRELDHRTKNLLAVVQSIAMQTAQHSKDLNAFRSAFSQRIGALSRSLDLLVRDGEPGVSVSELVQRQLEPFTNVDKDRIVVGGPNALLNQEATQTLGFALHELATNATKYGALSVAGGRISVTWDLAPCNSGAERFRLIWREENGPPVAPPTTRGFGTVILNHVGASMLSGNVQHDFDVNGVRWSLDVPASACLVADKAFRAAQHSPVSASTHAPSVRATRYIPTLSVACGLGHDRIGD